MVFVKNKIEPFEGVRGLTCAPNNNLSVPEAVELFCDNELFSLFVEHSNLYRNQNADKYDIPEIPKVE